MRRWFWVLDGLVVVAFVVIGREDHGYASDLADYLRVASPFLLALAVTVGVTRAWRQPTSLVTGLFLALGTVAIGMLLRRFVWDDGTARPFVIVTSLFLIAGMVGWRLVAVGVHRMRTSRRAQAS
jgi:Protein of unknown function (DUF3054)